MDSEEGQIRNFLGVTELITSGAHIVTQAYVTHRQMILSTGVWDLDLKSSGESYLIYSYCRMGGRT
jgi:hypothetical protein